MRVGVVDYDAGNLRSVQTALRHLGADYTISGEPRDLAAVDRLIFPGVGEAASAMAVLKARGLDTLILDFAASGSPLLGICLGFQILMDHSEERDTRCLGVLEGDVRRFAGNRRRLKIPHMGWNTVAQRQEHRIFAGIPDNASFYFVHSYYVAPASQRIVIGATEYGAEFTSAAAHGNVVAVQFHPEKSGEHGLAMLRNFIEL